MLTIKPDKFFKSLTIKASFLKESNDVCCGQPYFYAVLNYHDANTIKIYIGISDEDDYDLYYEDLIFTDSDVARNLFHIIADKFVDLQYEVSHNLDETFEKYLTPFYEYVRRNYVENS